MFKLKLKDGVEVSTLEELRENFDLERVVEYFKSGDLLTWLEDRFYDDEADAISETDASDRNLTAKICAALNVECDDNLEFMRRVREKKSILSEKTDDQSIIDNADKTALNQEDLAMLIQMDYKTIYLCGEQFNVPIRVGGVKYIGILGTPKIKIRAQSQDDLDAKQISFENVQLPWQKAAPIDELKALAEKIFQTGGKWLIVNYSNKKYKSSSFDQLDKVEKSAVLRMICQGKYEEHQIAFLQVTEDLSSGFAMTIDSFCTGGGVGANIIPYKEIKRSTSRGNGFCVEKSNQSIHFGDTYYFILTYDYKSPDSPLNPHNFHIRNHCQNCEKLFVYDSYEKVKNFLEIAKNF